jgi:RimJ/RimL family protein N-acetyltransferase
MIRLAYFEKNDFAQLIEWVNSEELLTNWSGNMFSFPLTQDSLEWYLRDTNEPGKSDAFIYKAIDEDEDGDTVGHISLGGFSSKNKSARISRVLVGDSGKRNKGVCQGMVNAVLKIGFEEMGLHRIGLGVYDSNLSAINCYQKCGLVIEGTNRDILWYKNTYWSMIEMSMLEEEWRTLQ